MTVGTEDGPDAMEPGAAPARLRDMVVVGASAGGVEPLRELVRGLPPDLPATMLIVLHTAPGGRGALARILQRAAALEVTPAEDMAPVRPGRVYVARPDCHLLLRDGEVRLGRGPRENGHRPAVDPLFRSAARWYAARTVAVVLSGLLDDGAAGAAAVARRGGTVAVQDPAEAMFDGMPSAALRAVSSALVAPAAQLAGHVTRLVREPAGVDLGDVTDDLRLETDLAELAEEALRQARRPGRPSPVSCPDCHGVLFEITEDPGLRYRCRVGHAWSPEALESAKDQEVEDAMWIAVRNLEERTAFYRELAERAAQTGRSRAESGFRQRCEEADRAAGVIRDLLASARLELTGQPGAGDRGQAP